MDTQTEWKKPMCVTFLRIQKTFYYPLLLRFQWPWNILYLLEGKSVPESNTPSSHRMKCCDSVTGLEHLRFTLENRHYVLQLCTRVDLCRI